MAARGPIAAAPGVALHCPGLFAVPDGLSEGGSATPALDRLIARSDPLESAPRDPLETLAAELGVGRWPKGDLPSAALSLLAEAGDRAVAGYWLHADPIHLYPDRDRLLLFGGPGLLLTAEESDQLVCAFNGHFAADGLALTATRPGRWYLRTAEPPSLETRPLHAVVGRPVDRSLPTGADAQAWTRWQTEAQMLLHAHPANRAREDCGRPTVNGIWTWGGGVLPQVSGGPDLILADHPLAVGLARASGRRVIDLDALISPREPWGDAIPSFVLVFWDPAWWPALEGDTRAWREAILGLEAVVARLLAGLASGKIRWLALDDGERWRFRIDRRGLRRFWRRRGGLSDWSRLSQPASERIPGLRLP